MNRSNNCCSCASVLSDFPSIDDDAVGCAAAVVGGGVDTDKDVGLFRGNERMTNFPEGYHPMLISVWLLGPDICENCRNMGVMTLAG